MKLSINKDLLPVKAHYFFFMSGEFTIVHNFNLIFIGQTGHLSTSPTEINLIIHSCNKQTMLFAFIKPLSYILTADQKYFNSCDYTYLYAY